MMRMAAVLILIVLLSAIPAYVGQGPSVESTPPLRAIGIDPAVTLLDAQDFDDFRNRVCNANANFIGISAGRLDWNYFRWQGHERYWASQLSRSEKDPLLEAVEAMEDCPSITHTSAIIDVFAPRYIAEHPDAAAYDVDGNRIPHQVSSVELAHGSFGEQLLDMIEYLAREVPVQSVSITELHYYREGYGPDDLSSYREYTGESDWPRQPSGRIDVNDPRVGEWRSNLISHFIQRAAAILHVYGKELIVDVRVPWGDLENRGRENGQDYDQLLQYADKLVLWLYFGLNDYSADYVHQVAAAYRHYGQQRLIISYGLWARHGEVLPASELALALRESRSSGLPNVWITPASLIEKSHWEVLESNWAP